MYIDDLETPALLIDLDIMERNLRRAADYARGHGLRLRPHTKTHKIPLLARKQLELGAAGLTVAKVGEAEVMQAATPPELLVAYPVVGRSKAERLAAVARNTPVTVALDSLFAARQLSEATSRARVQFGVLVEVDAGYGRVGVPPGEVRELAAAIRGLPGIDFHGIAFFPGHILEMGEPALRALCDLRGVITAVLSDLKRAGIPVRIVSGGSSPTLFHSHLVPEMNEIRPGTYIFNDRNTLDCAACGLEDCAASVLTTVVSASRAGRIIVDGGSKTFSSDGPVGRAEVSFGHVVEAPEAVFFRMNEEHGYIDVAAAERSFEVGERLRIIPNHICPAVNLHAQLYGIHGRRVEQVWAVEGRGRIQ
jgi:D-serine deaminase-like pyridoxal phosphate-dependent protein